MAIRHRHSPKGTEEQTGQHAKTKPVSIGPVVSPDVALPGLLQHAAAQPRHMTPGGMQMLQRAYGNRAVGGLLSPSPAPISRQQVPSGTVQAKRGWRGLFKENYFKYRKKVAKYNECLGKGQSLWQRVEKKRKKLKKSQQTVVEGVQSVPNKNEQKLASDYNTTIGGTSEWGFDFHIITKPKDSQRAPESYDNFISVTRGAIKAYSNERRIRATDGGYTLSKIPNSDVLWFQYKKAKEKAQTRGMQEMSGITQVKRTSIKNQDALTTMDIALDDGTKRKKTFGQGNEEFMALLGTPNGKSSLWLLHDHMSVDWLKTVDTVTPTLNDDPSLEIKYKDAD